MRVLQTLSLGTLLTGLCLLPLGGCDKLGEGSEGRADRQVQADLDRAATESNNLPTLQQAANNSGASPAVQAQAKAAHARGQLDEGSRLVDQIAAKQLDASRLAGEIEHLGWALHAGNRTIQVLGALDPKAAIAKVDEMIAQARGGEGKEAWFNHDGVQLPTLSAADGQIKRLQGEVDKLQKQIDALTTQRAAVMAEADKLAAQSEAQKGNESVQTYKQSVDQRKKAADLAIQIDALKATLRPQQESLAVAQTQYKVVEEALKQFEEMKARLNQSWQKVQAVAKTQGESARKVYEGGAFAAPEAGAQSAALADLIKRYDALDKEIQGLRDQAVKSLEGAADSYKAAGQAASRVATAYNTRANALPQDAVERKAFKAMQEMFNPMTYALPQAQAQRMLADLKADEAVAFSARAKLVAFLDPILQQAGLVRPAELGAESDLSEKAKNALAAAQEQYKAAEEALIGFETAGTATPEQKRQAKVSQALVNHAWAQLARMMGDDKTYNDLITKARTLSRDALADNARLPMGLPPEIAPAVAAPTTQTVPTSAPSTAPAE